MTFQEWGKREDYVELWKKTWNEPHMRAGMTALIHLGLPQLNQLTPANGECIQLRALAHSRNEGWYAALKAIDFLKTPKTEPQELPAPWEDVNQ